MIVRLALCALCVFLLSCGDSGGETQVYLLSNVEIIFEEGDGPVGVDLDGVSSTAAMDPGTGCAHEDYEGGIDSSLVRLNFSQTLGEFAGDPNVPLAMTIASGRLSILVEASDIDSFENDDFVALRIVRGVGTVQAGPDGALAGQTFAESPDFPPAFGRGRIRNGQLSIDVDGELEILVAFLQAEGPVRMRNLRATSLQLSAVGDLTEFTGVLGAVINTSDVVDVVARINLADPVIGIAAAAFFGTFADIGRDENGTCQWISLGLRVRAVEAFLFAEE